MAFPFLSLPAGKQNNIPPSHQTLTKSPELRTHIYLFAAPTENPIHISCATSPKRRQSIIAASPKSPFGVLTRVNRQIRSEYHAIQRDHVRIIVDWDEMPQYIATFCRRDPALPMVLPHNLTVYVKVTRLQAASEQSCLQFEIDSDYKKPGFTSALGVRRKTCRYNQKYLLSMRECQQLNWLMRLKNKKYLEQMRSGKFEDVGLRIGGRRTLLEVTLVLKGNKERVCFHNLAEMAKVYPALA